MKFALLFFLAAATLHAQSGMLRYPDIRADRVLFSYAGDVWSVPATGGDAVRLTSHAGYESLPKFSPDGRWIAFNAEYEGNGDVYVMSANGGEPKRITFHPYVDRVTGWTRDGRIVFRSKRTSEVQQYDKLFTVGVNGGWPEELPLPSVSLNSFSPDGTKIAAARSPGSRSSISARTHTKKCRTPMPPTSGRCGSATRFTSSPIATAS
jgi:tricorn protease